MLFLLPMDFGPKSPQPASDASSGHGHGESPGAEGAGLGEPHWDTVPPRCSQGWCPLGHGEQSDGQLVPLSMSVSSACPSCHCPVLQPPCNQAGPSFWDDRGLGLPWAGRRGEDLRALEPALDWLSSAGLCPKPVGKAPQHRLDQALPRPRAIRARPLLCLGNAPFVLYFLPLPTSVLPPRKLQA